MLVSKECWERGCSCFDDRVDKDPVEVVKREWVGLTEDEIHEAFNYVEFVKHISWDRQTEDWCKNFAAYIETRLKEKNHETRPLDPQGQRQDPL